MGKRIATTALPSCTSTLKVAHALDDLLTSMLMPSAESADWNAGGGRTILSPVPRISRSAAFVSDIACVQITYRGTA